MVVEIKKTLPSDYSIVQYTHTQWINIEGNKLWSNYSQNTKIEQFEILFRFHRKKIRSEYSIYDSYQFVIIIISSFTCSLKHFFLQHWLLSTFWRKHWDFSHQNDCPLLCLTINQMEITNTFSTTKTQVIISIRFVSYRFFDKKKNFVLFFDLLCTEKKRE